VVLDGLVSVDVKKVLILDLNIGKVNCLDVVNTKENEAKLLCLIDNCSNSNNL
jgi:hypothetical protein